MHIKDIITAERVAKQTKAIYGGLATAEIAYRLKWATSEDDRRFFHDVLDLLGTPLPDGYQLSPKDMAIALRDYGKNPTMQVHERISEAASDKQEDRFAFWYEVFQILHGYRQQDDSEQ